MAIIGQKALPSQSNYTVATAPSLGATVNVLFCNRTANAIQLRLAIVQSGQTLTDDMWIMYDLSIGGNQVIERCGIPLAVGDFVVARASATGVSCSVVGALGS
jgi:hypothetical protein